jgi:hypothetical protein
MHNRKPDPKYFTSSSRRGPEIIVDSIVVPKSKPVVVRWLKDLGNGAYRMGLEVRRRGSLV